MTTLYFVNGASESGDTMAFGTQNDAKEAARKAHERDSEPHHVVKVELKEKVGSRELMCALFNGETDKFTGSKETIYTAPARGRGRPVKGDEPEPEDNPFDI